MWVAEQSTPFGPCPLGGLPAPAYLAPWRHDHYHYLQGCGPQQQEQLPVRRRGRARALRGVWGPRGVGGNGPGAPRSRPGGWQSEEWAPLCAAGRPRLVAPPQSGGSVHFSHGATAEGTVGGRPMAVRQVEVRESVQEDRLSAPLAILVRSGMVGSVSTEPRKPAGPWFRGPLSHPRATRSCL